MSEYNRNRPKKKASLTHGWIVVPSKTYPDRVYFYNTLTKCSTWTNPCVVHEDKTETETPSKRFKSQQKPTETQRQTGSNFFSNGNMDIEDYDEQQDQYFDNDSFNTFNLSHTNLISPPSSPDSVMSFKTNQTDSGSSSKQPDGNEKELWLHFASNPQRSDVKKSLALSFLDKPSTSMEEKSGTNSKDIPRKDKKNKKKKKKERKKDEKEKSINTVSFKKTDKTPAQTRLLKLRQQNMKLLKSFGSKEMSEFPKSKNPEIFQDGVSHPQIETPSKDFVEEMDWEPSTEEFVMNINVFRNQNQHKTNELPQNFLDLNSDTSSTLSTNAYSWFLVFDTNIFVSCLKFVKDLRDTKIGGLNYPVMYVPWTVLQELDHLKDSKMDGAHKHLNWNVRKAIAYLNSNFKSRHPRCFGQSFEDFSKMVGTESYAPDDEILQTCIQLQKLHPDVKLILLTNDKNLESKALVSGVEACSKDGFQKKYLVPQSSSQGFKAPQGSGSKRTSRVDTIVCEVKTILKNFIPLVVETEMKAAFEGDWIILAHKKPPWTLQDAFDCLFKHWRSVFFLVFSKETLQEAEKLYEMLFKREPSSLDDVRKIISTIHRLVGSIKRSQKSQREYLELMEGASSKLSSLLEDPSQVERGPPPEELANRNLSQIKDLFKYIWDSFRSFCCSMSDAIGGNNNNSGEEIRLKLCQSLTQLGELIVSVEKTLGANPPDLNEHHPLVTHLGLFLIHLCPAMDPVLRARLPESLARFFTDFEGRSLVIKALDDFRDFSRDISKAAEYLEAHPQF